MTVRPLAFDHLEKFLDRATRLLEERTRFRVADQFDAATGGVAAVLTPLPAAAGATLPGDEKCPARTAVEGRVVGVEVQGEWPPLLQRTCTSTAVSVS